jgi:hypothetical protein
MTIQFTPFIRSAISAVITEQQGKDEHRTDYCVKEFLPHENLGEDNSIQ